MAILLWENIAADKESEKKETATWQSGVCKIVAFTWRCNRTECYWKQWNRPSPELELTLLSPAGVLTMGRQPGTSPMTLCSSSGEERCCQSAASPRARGINSIAIAAGGTGNVEQDSLPPHPHPLGARRAVRSCLFSGLHCLCQQIWEQLEIEVSLCSTRAETKMRIAGGWLFCL